MNQTEQIRLDSYVEVKRGPLNWGWVKLAELAMVIGVEPSMIWDQYFSFSKDAEVGVLTWMDRNGDVYQDGSRPTDWDTVWVPAGWAKDVLGYEIGWGMIP